MDSVYLEEATGNLDRQVNTIVLVLTGKKIHIGRHIGKLFRVNGGNLGVGIAGIAGRALGGTVTALDLSGRAFLAWSPLRESLTAACSIVIIALACGNRLTRHLGTRHRITARHWLTAKIIGIKAQVGIGMCAKQYNKKKSQQTDATQRLQFYHFSFLV